MRKKFTIGIFMITAALAACLCSCNTSKTEEQSVEATTQIQEETTEISAEDLETATKVDLETGEETILSKDDMSESDPNMKEASDGSGDKDALKDEIKKAQNDDKVDMDADENFSDLFKANIYGKDDRHIIGKKYLTRFPNRAVVYILSRYPNGSWHCGTGYMIGRNTIGTAAHCIYSYDDGGYPLEMRLYPGKKGDYTPYGMTYACDFVVPTEYISRSKVTFASSRYDTAMQKVDYGIIHVNNNLGDVVGWFGFRTYGGLKSKSKDYHMVGYYDGKLTTQQGENLVYSYDNKFLKLYFDVVGGQSGSPIFFSQKGSRYVIGHLTSESRESNEGLAITNEIMEFYRRYKR